MNVGNVELRGITISNSDRTNINVQYTVTNPVDLGNDRVWQGVAVVNDTPTLQEVYLVHDATLGWVFCNTPVYASTSTIYAQERGDANALATVKDPWDAAWSGGANYPVFEVTDPDPYLKLGELEEKSSTVNGSIVNKQYRQRITNTLLHEYWNVSTVASDVTTTTERFDAPNLVLGNIYRFQFVRDFEDLGYIADDKDERYSIHKGIYRVDKILSYLELIAGGIDLYTNLYAPLGLSKEYYQRDEPSFKGKTFYKLVDPKNTNVVIYMPISFIKGTPNNAVAEYSKLLLTIDLGVFSDTEMLVDMLDIFLGLLKARWGITPKSVYNTEDPQADDAIIQFQTYDSVWLTTEEYELLELLRDNEKKNALATSTVLQKLVTSELNRYVAENDKLKTQNQAYEEIIESINS